MTCTSTGKISISDNEVVGSLKPISKRAAGSTPESRSYRDTKHDISVFNDMVKTCKTVQAVLAKSSYFLNQKFGHLTSREIYMRKIRDGKPELISKCQCSCGNDVTTPLSALVDGSLTNCGCRTPLPKKYANNTTVIQSDEPTRWTTTVDGIQWFGNRYMWFVTLFVNGICVLREYTSNTKEALRIRKEAEIKYYGYSPIERYENAMYFELEQFKRAYMAKCPPKVEGIYYNKIEKLWNAKLRKNGKFVYDKYFDTREQAVKARLAAERRYYGAPLMALEYYV